VTALFSVRITVDRTIDRFCGFPFTQKSNKFPRDLSLKITRNDAANELS